MCPSRVELYVDRVLSPFLSSTRGLYVNVPKSSFKSLKPWLAHALLIKCGNVFSATFDLSASHFQPHLNQSLALSTYKPIIRN